MANEFATSKFLHICTPALLLLGQLFTPLLGRTTSRGRSWAAIRLCHRPEPSGHAVHGEVDGLDIGGQHGRRFVLLRRTSRPQRRPYPICTGRSGNVRHRCGGGWAGPRLLGGSLRGGGYRSSGGSKGDLGGSWHPRFLADPQFCV